MTPETKFMPVRDTTAAKTIKLPWAMIEGCEKRAMKNHFQTLDRLCERGGLSADEALAILDDRDWKAVPRANPELLRRIEAAGYQAEAQTFCPGCDAPVYNENGIRVAFTCGSMTIAGVFVHSPTCKLKDKRDAVAQRNQTS